MFLFYHWILIRTEVLSVLICVQTVCKCYQQTFYNYHNYYEISELLSQADGEEETPLCRKYREELEQLRDEFERYRLRAQSVLKNKKVRLFTLKVQPIILKNS